MIDDTIFSHRPNQSTALPGEPSQPSSAGGGEAAPGAPAPAEPAEPPAPMTAAQSKFQSCRWRKPSEAGSAAFCTHRDVLPMAGTTGFSPESWCPDCTFYKLRRVPRRHEY